MITKSIEDVGQYFPVHDINMSFEKTFKRPIQRQIDRVIVKHIGLAQYNALENYTGDDETIKKAIDLVRDCEVNLGANQYLPFAPVQITGSGVVFVAPENSTSGNQTDIRDIQRSTLKIGLQALDDLLSLMQSNLSKFPSYQSSQAYNSTMDFLVHSASIFDKYYSINGSVQTYLSLLPDLKLSERQYIVPAISKEMLQELKKPTLSYTEIQQKVFDELKELVQNSIVLFTVHETIGNGFYYQSDKSFHLRFDILDYERKVISKQTLSEHLNDQKSKRLNQANEILKDAVDLIKSNLDVFTMYVENTTEVEDTWISTQGNVFF